MEPPTKRIHYGELDAKQAVSQGGSENDATSAVAAGIAAGNINIGSVGQNVDDEDFEISESAMQTLEKQAEKLKQLETIRKQARVVVPVLDEEVKTHLRALGQPICLFGEGAVDRRDRLRMLVARQDIDAEELKRIEALRDVTGGLKQKSSVVNKGRPIKKQTTVIYTTASAELIQARKQIAKGSWVRSRERLNDQRVKRESTKAALQDEIAVSKLYSNIQGLRVNSSQFSGKDNTSYRPLTSCAFSPDQSLVATGTLDINVSLWDSTSCGMIARLEGHSERVHDLAFHPEFRRNQQRGTVSLATASADQTVCLWKLDDLNLNSAESNTVKQPVEDKTESDVKREVNGTISDDVDMNGNVSPKNEIGSNKAQGGAENKLGNEVELLSPACVLKGHKHRLARVVWHPMGNWVASSSYDHTWRLWDIEHAKELLLQDGHSREVYGLAIHPDGSLLASGDLGGVGRVWDLRSGRSVYAMVGHAKGVLSMDFSPNGYHLASASEDHSVRIWDLRRKKPLYTIAAHGHLIPTVKFAPNSGSFLVTCSFDRTVKVWSARDWSLLKHLSGHENKVMDFDISADDKHLLTGSYDRTWKLWAHESEF